MKVKLQARDKSWKDTIERNFSRVPINGEVIWLEIGPPEDHNIRPYKVLEVYWLISGEASLLLTPLSTEEFAKVGKQKKKKKKWFWHNDVDTWYNINDWVIAESPEECNKIPAKERGVSLKKILKRKYGWYKKKKAKGKSRYLGFSNDAPQI